MASKAKKILISQPEPTSGRSPYYAVAEKYGYEVEFKQLIQTVPLEASEFRRQRLDIMQHTAILFISKTAIDNFFALAKEMRLEMPESMKYFCPNETISLYLQKYIVYRKRKIFFGETGRLSDLVAVAAKPSHAKEQFLIPLNEDYSGELLPLMEAKKLRFSPAIVFRTVSREMPPEMKLDHDVIIFFSPGGIKAVQERFPDFVQGKRLIAAFGPLTKQAIEEAGMRCDIEAPTPEHPSMHDALDHYLAKHRTAK